MKSLLRSNHCSISRDVQERPASAGGFARGTSTLTSGGCRVCTTPRWNNSEEDASEPKGGKEGTHLPVDSVEEADEGVDGGGEPATELGGDAAEELRHHVGVLIRRRPHLLHRAPNRRCRRRGGGRSHVSSSLSVSSNNLGRAGPEQITDPVCFLWFLLLFLRKK